MTIQTRVVGHGKHEVTFHALRGWVTLCNSDPVDHPTARPQDAVTCRGCTGHTYTKAA